MVRALMREMHKGSDLPLGPRANVGRFDPSPPHQFCRPTRQSSGPARKAAQAAHFYVRLFMKRPSLEADESEILEFTRAWIRYVAKHGLDEALHLIDQRDGDSPWSEAFVRTISEDHFGDGETCVITDPDEFSELRVDAYRYTDGSGFAVDHDLAMNRKRSDFTAQFEFTKTKYGYVIYLKDIHVL